MNSPQFLLKNCLVHPSSLNMLKSPLPCLSKLLRETSGTTFNRVIIVTCIRPFIMYMEHMYSRMVNHGEHGEWAIGMRSQGA